MAATTDVKQPIPPIKEPRAARLPMTALINNGLMPLLAVFTGLVVGGIIIAIANDAAITAWQHFFQAPLAALKASWAAVMTAYGALFGGALGHPADIVAGFRTY